MQNERSLDGEGDSRPRRHGSPFPPRSAMHLSQTPDRVRYSNFHVCASHKHTSALLHIARLRCHDRGADPARGRPTRVLALQGTIHVSAKFRDFSQRALSGNAGH